MPDYHIVVLDIGKTNKKLFVYDSDLRCLNPEETGRSAGDFLRHRGEARPLRRRGRHPALDDRRAPARGGAVQGHPRHLHLDARSDDRASGQGGRPGIPRRRRARIPGSVVRARLGASQDEAFYADMGMSPEDVQRETATARFGWFLNSAKQVWWLAKRFPYRFAARDGHPDVSAVPGVSPDRQEGR